MKLEDRECVDGTKVTIGRRVYYRNKKKTASRCYAAEYRDLDGRQVCRNLRTRNRGQARRKALEIQQELESGVQCVPETNLAIENLVERYRQGYQAKGLAPKTEWKYRADLNKLEAYCAQAEIK
jgi:hypothetical protein